MQRPALIALTLGTLTLGTLCLSAPRAAAAADDVTCTGTEPFWKLEISEGEFYLQDGNKVSGYAELELKVGKPRHASGAEPDAVRVYETTTGGKNGKPVIAIVQKREGSKCSDGISDPVFPYDVVLITPRSVFTGCCK
jgi:uncharacterized membrane protein